MPGFVDKPTPRLKPELRQYLGTARTQVERGVTQPNADVIVLPKRHAPPVRRPGGVAIIAYADGTDWNPGAGEGVYAFYSGVWNKLG